MQYVNWAGRGSGQRGYCGTIASGVIRPGEKVKVLPSGKESRVKKIVTYQRELPYAYSPQAVTIYLEDDLDISRGDMIVREKNLPAISRGFEANMVWMDNTPLVLNRPYLVKHTSHAVRGEVEQVSYRLDPEDLHRKPADTLRLNEIGRVTLRLMAPVYADTYEHNRNTGCFILIDPVTYQTAAAGMVTRCTCREPVAKKKPDTARTIWVTGPAGMGRKLYEEKSLKGRSWLYLDDDLLDQGICSDLKGSKNPGAWLERVAHVCRTANMSGVSVVLQTVRNPGETVTGIIGADLLEILDSGSSR